jgi:hypothetical protein
MVRHKIRNITKAEIEFGKLGYNKREEPRLIIYYKPYKYDDIRVDDITFCKETKKIIFYQGTELGSDAYKMNPLVLKAIMEQCKELGWDKEIEEGVINGL